MIQTTKFLSRFQTMCHNTTAATAFFVKKPPQNSKFNDRNFDLTNIKVINASSGITQLDSLLLTLLLYCLKKLLFVLNSQFEMLFTTQVCKNEKKMFSKKGLYEYDAVNENIFNFTNCTNPVAPIKNANLLGHWSKKSTSWQWCNFTWKSPTNLCETFAEFIGFQNLGCGSTLVVSKRLAADDSWNPKERKISLSFYVKRTCNFQWRIYKTHFGFEIFSAWQWHQFSWKFRMIFLSLSPKNCSAGFAGWQRFMKNLASTTTSLGRQLAMSMMEDCFGTMWNNTHQRSPHAFWIALPCWHNVTR